MDKRASIKSDGASVMEGNKQPPNPEIVTKQRKRGMKPRSKRNRKRPRSEAHSLPEELDYEVSVRRLELDGVPLSTTLPQWLRIVEPYPYTFSSFAKARWVGRTVLDVYATEFGSYPKSYYEVAISQGRILVSDQAVDVDYIIKGSDVLSHTVHRHEPGVAVQTEAAPYVKVVQDSGEVLVVDKPSTVPVHPCGGYHVQSLMNILEKHYGYKLYTIHRLDRLTSGLVILGKTSQVAQQWGKSIMNRDCQKIYLARVKGKFPLNCPTGLRRIDTSTSSAIPWHGEWEAVGDDKDTKNLAAGAAKHAADASQLRKSYVRAYWIANEHGEVINDDDFDLKHIFNARLSVDAWLKSLEPAVQRTQSEQAPTNDTNNCWFHLACPTRIAQHKDGVCEAGSFGDLDDAVYKKTVKPAASSFGVVSYDDKTDSTLLICRPHTGRTHQLRLHLQHLGHPIANDPNYGGDIFYCNETAREASKRAQEKLDTVVEDPAAASIVMDTGKTSMTTATDVPATEAEVQTGIVETKKGAEESIHDFIRRTCVWCARCKAMGGEDRAILEFMIRSPGIWLHALKYSFSPSTSISYNGNNQVQQQQQFRVPLPSWHDVA